MSTYRIYVDSRDRKDGTPESFEFQLPYSLAIREKSLANIDVVVVPNSIMTVIPGVNDIIYLTERSQINQVWHRTPRIAPGYYNVESLKLAIQNALSEGSNFPTGSTVTTYTVTYDERLARFTFKAFAQRFGFNFTIYSKEAQELGGPSVPSIVENGNGSWRLLGMVSGPSTTSVGDMDETPVVANGAPNLQYATQLFIKTDLGISARSVGPKGNQSCQRRVVIDAPTFGLVVDRHSTSWDSFEISPNTTIASFTVQLTDYNGNVVDLNGQNWSFSISIYREDI